MKLQGNNEEKNEKLLIKLFKKNPKMCQLTLDLKPFRPYIKGKCFAGKEFQSLTIDSGVR